MTLRFVGTATLVAASFAVGTATPTVRLQVPPPGRYGIEDLWKARVSTLDPADTARDAWFEGFVYERTRGQVFYATTKPFRLSIGTRVYQYRDVRVDKTQTAPGYEAFVTRQGTLPQGMYSFKLILRPFGVDDSNGFEVKPMGPPRLISPADGAKLPAQERYPMFKWTPPSPSRAGARYALSVVEVLPGQTAKEAIWSNQPWHEGTGLTGQSQRYPVAGRALGAGRQYAWQIRMLDSDGRTIAESEIWTFTPGVPTGPRVPVPAPLRVSRAVERRGNHFTSILTVENRSGLNLSEVTVTERSQGLAYINKCHHGLGTSGPLGPAAACELSIPDAWAKTSRVDVDMGALRDDRAQRVKFYLVPALYHGVGAVMPVIGAALSVSYRVGDRRYSYTFDGLADTMAAAVDSALAAADYLITTSPRKLHFAEAPPRSNLPALHSAMAELAKEKNGVLGYLPDWAWCWTLKNLLVPGGVWRASLDHLAYLLIVGEENIVSSWDVGDGRSVIHITDYPYADLEGDEQPEVKVGRIIGDDAVELRQPISAALEVNAGDADYDGSNAELISGPEDTWEKSVMYIDSGRVTLSGKGVHVAVVHTDYYTTELVQLAEALRIIGPPRGAEWADGGDHHYLERRYNATQLAGWLLWTRSLLTPGINKDSVLRDRTYAGSVITRAMIESALTEAETVQAENDSRGGRYGQTYSYLADSRAAEQRRCEAIKDSLLPHRDLIVFLGHGDPGGWCGSIAEWPGVAGPVEPISFGRTRPVVMAWSCQTGDYRETGGAPSIAKAFFRNRAAVYIGATEPSSTGCNEQMTGREMWRDWTRDSRIGDAFFAAKARKLRDGWRGYVMMYNLYGDPKFGRRLP